MVCSVEYLLMFVVLVNDCRSDVCFDLSGVIPLFSLFLFSWK